MAKKVVDAVVNKAAAAGDLELLQRHLDGGESIEEIQPITGFRPLHTAAAEGHLNMVQHLIKSGANLNSLSDPEYPAPFEDCTALIVAAAKGHASIVRELVEAGADVNINVLSDRVSTAISYAAAAGEAEIARFLLAHGAVIEGPILYGPVWSQDVEMVEFLIREGADVNAKSGEGKPMLVRACDKQAKFANLQAQLSIVKSLVAAGADIEARDDLGATSLIAAVRAKNKPLALELLRLGANAQAADDGNMTALHSAATDGDLELAKALLDAGAKTDIKNTFGETAESRAKENKDKAMLGLLASYPS